LAEVAVEESLQFRVRGALHKLGELGRTDAGKILDL
jgi:hypothetical protein